MCHSQDPCSCRGHSHYGEPGPMYSPWFLHCPPKPPARETQIKFYEQLLESIRAYEKEIEEYIAELKEKE